MQIFSIVLGMSFVLGFLYLLNRVNRLETAPAIKIQNGKLVVPKDRILPSAKPQAVAADDTMNPIAQHNMQRELAHKAMRRQVASQDTVVNRKPSASQDTVVNRKPEVNRKAKKAKR